MRRALLFLLLTVLPLASCKIAQEAQLTSAVVKALKADPRTADYKFEVSQPEPGIVLITGEVHTTADIEAVTEIAKKVPGVTTVQNNTHVEEPGSDMMQDTVVPGVGGFL